MPDGVALEAGVGVAGILRPLQTSCAHDGGQFILGAVEHRPNVRERDGGNPLRSGRPTAMQQAHQDSLGLVVGGMAGGDVGERVALGNVLQCSAPQVPGSFLDAAFAPGGRLLDGRVAQGNDLQLD